MMSIRRHAVGQINAGFDQDGNPIFAEGPQQQTSVPATTYYVPNISYGTPSTAKASSDADAKALATLLAAQQQGRGSTTATPTPTWVYAAGAGVALLAVILVMGK